VSFGTHASQKSNYVAPAWARKTMRIKYHKSGPHVGVLNASIQMVCDALTQQFMAKYHSHALSKTYRDGAHHTSDVCYPKEGPELHWYRKGRAPALALACLSMSKRVAGRPRVKPGLALKKTLEEHVLATWRHDRSSKRRCHSPSYPIYGAPAHCHYIHQTCRKERFREPREKAKSCYCEKH